MRPTPLFEAVPETRRALVLAIRKRGQARAEDLCDEAGVSLSAVRQQLLILERQGLITHRTLGGNLGRPHHLYSLTGKADILFPDNYRSLTIALLKIVVDQAGNDFRALWSRVTRGERALLLSRTAGMAPAQALDEVISQGAGHGYLAEKSELGDGTLLLSLYSCPFLEIAKRYPHVCQAEQDVIEAACGVRIRRVAHVLEGAPVCDYLVPAAREQFSA